MSDVVMDEESIKYLVDGNWINSIIGNGFTYNDYKNWPEDIHAEIIDGQVYLMAAPNERHSFIQNEIAYQLTHYFRGKTCTVHTAKFGVRLAYEESGLDKTTVEPDIIIVCDQSIVHNKPTCQGVPDFILEIISRGESKKDLLIKKERYERAGVKEYWVVGQKHLHVFTLANGKYLETVKELSPDLKQPLALFHDCVIDFQLIADRYKDSKEY